jgi:LmbE family N-acetylglucosaminyl deacetylase
MITTSTYTKTFLFIYSFLPLLICSFAFAQAPKSYTSSEILLQLKKLNTVGSVLYIAAHPDDENTRLIAYLANEKCLRTGYLSLTRGDGGQNLIGPEQGIELGVIRTQELLAARRMDGGEQFFTRAYDFGYSKSPEETFTKWNKDSILGDMVWVIRNFRPDIIITRFATDGTGGHGHHTASAILAEEAFDAAADPSRFPEQLQYVTVWKTRRLFQNSTARFFNPNADLSHLIKLDVGGYNPLLGKSYGEIAAESRSMHKSQGFGSAKQRGEIFEYFKPVKGDTAGLKDIFEGIDFTWKRVKGHEKIGDMIASLVKSYTVQQPELSIPKFKLILAEMNTLDVKKSIPVFMLANNILFNLSGLVLDATISEPNITLGSKQKLTINIVGRSNAKIVIDKIQFIGNLKNEHFPFDTLLNKIGKKNELVTYTFQSEYGKSDVISQPYNLLNPIKNNMFDIDDRLNRSAPESFLNNSGVALLTIEGYPILYPFNFQYKQVDPEKGELYRPLVITPPVMINTASKAVIFSEANTKQVSLTVKAGKENTNGMLKLETPANWKIEPAFVAFELLKKGEEKTITFNITPPTEASEATITAVAEINGQSYTKGIKEIKYDHIPVQTLFPGASVKLVKLDVVKKSKRIGYIPGAGDEVQACLSQLGYEVVILTDDMLAKENLSQFDAIITGVRAYNTNDKLPSFKQKIMDYVAAGGNVIVQYNTNSWAGPLASDIGPYKFKITRDRITNEDAKVNLLLPNHPVLNTPNKITEKDFEGWIQERSIYHAGDWDSNYVAPIGMADPNEKENKGALLIGKYGKGNFIYTGLVFFRELPAGVPGAYRLMVNLIELGK